MFGAANSYVRDVQERPDLLHIAISQRIGQRASRLSGRTSGSGTVAPNRTVIDIGGEGRHQGALNVNPGRFTSTTGSPGRLIPNHVPYDGKRLPFGDKSVTVIHLENAPIRPETIAEIQRILRPGGEIRLVGPADISASLHQQIAEAVGGRVFQVAVPTRHGEPSLFTNIIVPIR